MDDDSLQIIRLRQADSEALVDAVLSNEQKYYAYFRPFAFDVATVRRILAAQTDDRYWGMFCKRKLAGFFMLRGLDEGYIRPSFGVFISSDHARKGLAQLALRYAVAWCRLRGLPALMLKVHPDNASARRLYEETGFVRIGVCERTGHEMYEKPLK